MVQIQCELIPILGNKSMEASSVLGVQRWGIWELMKLDNIIGVEPHDGIPVALCDKEPPGGYACSLFAM